MAGRTVCPAGYSIARGRHYDSEPKCHPRSMAERNKGLFMSVRIAVVGAGIMGADHARILAQDVPGAVLQVVCDMSAERTRTVAEATGAQDTMTDPLAAIARKDVDAVLIASPDSTHPAYVTAALAARKPVLCEKPLAPTTAECRALVEAEIATGRRLLQVGFMRRYDPSYAAVKAAVDQGRIGAALIMHNFHRAVSAPSDFTGSMAITNAAPHEFDIARFILNTDVAAISAFAPAAASADLRCGPVLLVLETVRGQLVSIEVHVNATYGYDVKGEVVGNSGAVSLERPILSHVNSALTRSDIFPADWRPRFAEAYRLQDRDWIQSIQAGRPSAIGASAWDGYCAAIIAEAGVLALSGGKRVTIPLSKIPAFYGGSRDPHHQWPLGSYQGETA
jgi:myo-inositol 2-dehydrogenase/D-chiro-inositol 1-dehydrogenase